MHAVQTGVAVLVHSQDGIPNKQLPSVRFAVCAQAGENLLFLGPLARSLKKCRISLGVIAFCRLGGGSVSLVEGLWKGPDGGE
jgi:hypothetical protein